MQHQLDAFLAISPRPQLITLSQHKHKRVQTIPNFGISLAKPESR
jgi:hypothetical protein